MPIEAILQTITRELRGCPFLKGIVLGGSRATGCASEGSDIDIGLYYEGIDYARLNAIAQRLDDAHRENLVCREGEWGNWVNCGGWLVINGVHVDWILRDCARVKRILASSEGGQFSAHYQTGHPHAFLDVMYRGELASCKILHAADEEFTAMKKQAERYPVALKRALADFFSFESGFSCALAEKSAASGDISYVTGHAFRAVSALNQVLFALNEQWCLNEKKAVFRIDGFSIAPEQYSQSVAAIFRQIALSPAQGVQSLRALCEEVSALRAKQK